MAACLAVTVGLACSSANATANANAGDAASDQDSALTERTTAPRPPVMRPPIGTRPPIGRPPLPVPDRERPTRIDLTQMETVRKGPSVQFRNFGIKDPSTGQGNEDAARQIPADTILSLPNGKQIQAGEYFQQLNQFGLIVEFRGENDSIFLMKRRLEEALIGID